MADRTAKDAAPHSRDVAAAANDITPSAENLAGIARDALRLSPPLYFNSIFGPPSRWLPPYRRFDEFGIMSLWRPWRTLKFLQNTWLPSIPRTPPVFTPPFVNDLFWQPTVMLQRPDHNGSYTSFPEESWFFINGVMTNDAMAQVNAALLTEAFHRPITLIQNSTSSLLTDLVQCAVDKEGWRITEPVTKAFPAIYDALKRPDIKRVVVIAHSQGTIILAVILRLLNCLTRAPRAPRIEVPAPAAAYAPPEFIYPDDAPLEMSDFALLELNELEKLELYAFATCANVMAYFRPGIPYIEHFGNEFDIVARLGMQAPEPERWGIHIDGPRFVRPGAWGHLLNMHYLYPILDAQRVGRRRGGRGTPAPFLRAGAVRNGNGHAPRLYDYLNGGTPTA
jgi:hypothetical protein